jgi:hypothetical protein
MKRTLLDYVQSILSDLNSDEVNSIGDTVESQQVANIIRTKYYDILGRAELPEHDKLFHLTSSGDPLKPVLMYRPEEGVAKLNFVQYFNSNLTGAGTGEGSMIHDLDLDLNESDVGLGGASPPAYQDVEILPNKQFLDMVNTLDTTQTNVGSFEFDDQLYRNTELLDKFTLKYRNDKQPQFCTLIQNYYFVFDSYDNTQDSTLQSNKTLCQGFITPAWQMVDTFIPDLDDWAVPLLYNESLAVCTYLLKNTMNPHAEREIDRQWVALQKTKAVVNKPSFFDQLPNFGRRKWFP